MFRKLLLLVSLAAGSAAAQATGPYTVTQLGFITMTASGQTSNPISFPLLGGAYSAGTLTVTGVALTTATFGVLASYDGGVTYVPINIAAITALGTVATTATATVPSVYAVNLSNVTNVKFVTSGTFTATSITIRLAGTANGKLI